MKLLFISPRFSGGIGGHATMLADKLTERGFVAKMPNPKFPLSRYSATEISLFNALDGKEIIKTDYSWLKHFETLSKLPLPLTNGEILEDLFKKFIKNGEDWKDLFK